MKLSIKLVICWGWNHDWMCNIWNWM